MHEPEQCVLLDITFQLLRLFPEMQVQNPHQTKGLVPIDNSNSTSWQGIAPHVLKLLYTLSTPSDVNRRRVLNLITLAQMREAKRSDDYIASPSAAGRHMWVSTARDMHWTTSEGSRLGIGCHRKPSRVGFLSSYLARRRLAAAGWDKGS
ncbi:hypothetical protein EVAR_86664_1 [Eumeta japonica]|uniref:Uncharacterized protein n=1 Tax=Eumeta variegata TaxID=151549 RepID=A0A4C1Z737_EUMVA|nr:hypothetical protein EVAR_86664_1 [Eumeta japonica]